MSAHTTTDEKTDFADDTDKSVKSVKSVDCFLGRKSKMSTISSVPEKMTNAHSGSMNWLQRYPVLSYFIMALAFTWLPLLLTENGIGLIPVKLSRELFSLAGALLGPTVAAFVMTTVTAGEGGMKALLRRYGLWKVGVHWYLFVLFAFPVISLLVATTMFGRAPVEAAVRQWPCFYPSICRRSFPFSWSHSYGKKRDGGDSRCRACNSDMERCWEASGLAWPGVSGIFQASSLLKRSSGRLSKPSHRQSY